MTRRKKALTPDPVTRRRKAALDLALAMAIAVTLVLLNVSINFIDRIHDYFRTYYSFQSSDLLVNSLFVWLAGLLWIAFARWRSATRERSELEVIISSISPDVLLVVTPNRQVTMCSRSSLRMFGYTPKEIVGKTTDMLYSDRRADHSRPREIYDALRLDGFHLGTAMARRKNGDTFPLEIISGELTGRAGAVLLLRDISERVKAEQEQKRFEEEMQQDQKMDSLGLLAGGVAHDFNNMLSVVLGNAGIALMDLQADSAARQSIEDIIKAAERASGLCKQMLAYAGRAKFNSEPLGLADVVRETGRLVEVSLPPAVHVSYELDPECPQLYGDGVQLQQVVMNLLINAAESIGEVEGEVTVSTGIIYAPREGLPVDGPGHAVPEGEYVYVEVQDTGCGMDDETRRRIFDPFYTTKSTGKGLGLAAVLGIIRGHSGGMQVTTKPGEGSTFRAIFPVHNIPVTDLE